jgi:hypothetical protein
MHANFDILVSLSLFEGLGDGEASISKNFVGLQLQLIPLRQRRRSRWSRRSNSKGIGPSVSGIFIALGGIEARSLWG